MPRLSPSSKHHDQKPAPPAAVPPTVPAVATAGAGVPGVPDGPAPRSSFTPPATRTPAAATIATTARHDLDPRSTALLSSTSYSRSIVLTSPVRRPSACVRTTVASGGNGAAPPRGVSTVSPSGTARMRHCRGFVPALTMWGWTSVSWDRSGWRGRTALSGPGTGWCSRSSRCAPARTSRPSASPTPCGAADRRRPGRRWCRAAWPGSAGPWVTARSRPRRTGTGSSPARCAPTTWSSNGSSRRGDRH